MQIPEKDFEVWKVQKGESVSFEGRRKGVEEGGDVVELTIPSRCEPASFPVRESDSVDTSSVLFQLTK